MKPVLEELWKSRTIAPHTRCCPKGPASDLTVRNYFLSEFDLVLDWASGVQNEITEAGPLRLDVF